MHFPIKGYGSRAFLCLGLLLLFLAIYYRIWDDLFLPKAKEPPSFYASRVPAHPKFTLELQRLRSNQKLLFVNEELIKFSVKISAEKLDMPPGLLWCLLFQESRLNHLEGLEENSSALGLGQFSYYGFYEINHQLERYFVQGPLILIQVLGRDTRPISAKKDLLHHPSSYFFIPTAVVSSALYLNNRYLHLKRSLEAQSIHYDPQLLWLYATMAYNKGTRSVLSLWNEVRMKKGERAVERLVSDKEIFFATFSDFALYRRSLQRIWPPPTALTMAKELQIHLKQIRACSVPTVHTKGGT